MIGLGGDAFGIKRDIRFDAICAGSSLALSEICVYGELSFRRSAFACQIDYDYRVATGCKPMNTTHLSAKSICSIELIICAMFQNGTRVSPSWPSCWLVPPKSLAGRGADSSRLATSSRLLRETEELLCRRAVSNFEEFEDCVCLELTGSDLIRLRWIPRMIQAASENTAGCLSNLDTFTFILRRSLVDNNWKVSVRKLFQSRHEKNCYNC